MTDILTPEDILEMLRSPESLGIIGPARVAEAERLREALKVNDEMARLEAMSKVLKFMDTIALEPQPAPEPDIDAKPVKLDEAAEIIRDGGGRLYGPEKFFHMGITSGRPLPPLPPRSMLYRYAAQSANLHLCESNAMALKRNNGFVTFDPWTIFQVAEESGYQLVEDPWISNFLQSNHAVNSDWNNQHMLQNRWMFSLQLGFHNRDSWLLALRRITQFLRHELYDSAPQYIQTLERETLAQLQAIAAIFEQDSTSAAASAWFMQLMPYTTHVPTVSEALWMIWQAATDDIDLNTTLHGALHTTSRNYSSLVHMPITSGTCTVLRSQNGNLPYNCSRIPITDLVYPNAQSVFVDRYEPPATPAQP